MPPGLALYQFILPVLLLILVDVLLPLLDIVVNQVDLLPLLAAQAQDGASPEVYLILHQFHVLLHVHVDQLQVQLLDLQDLGQCCVADLVALDLGPHLVGLAENAVFLVIAQDGLDDIFVEVAAISLVLPEVPSAGVEGQNVADLGYGVDHEIEGGLVDVIGFEDVLEFSRLAVLRIAESVLHLLHVEVPEEGVKTTQVERVLGGDLDRPEELPEETHLIISQLFLDAENRVLSGLATTPARRPLPLSTLLLIGLITALVLLLNALYFV